MGDGSPRSEGQSHMSQSVKTLPPFRYGTEYEGSYYGVSTLILPSSRDHNLETVGELLKKHGKTARHLWVETQPGEVFNWAGVRQLLSAGYYVTVQIRDDKDIPPSEFTGTGLSVVWMVPPQFHGVMKRLDWIKVVHGPGPFDGYEIQVRHRDAFPAERYEKEDEVWPRE